MKQIETDALLVRSIAYGESDIIATLLTRALGKVSVMVRGGRKSTKRVGGAMEPFHTISVHLEDRGGELSTLREARIVRIRSGIAGSLAALDVAGSALRWARHLCPPRTPEPQAYETLIDLLDSLDLQQGDPRADLARAALRLLTDVGYALDLERCVTCGKACPSGRPAFVDAARGGIVCSSCGGARQVMQAELRAIARAAQKGGKVPMTSDQATAILGVVELAMAAHTGLET